MSIDPTRPSIDERYSGAIESSDLKVRPERADIDYIIAAGMVAESLGMSLWRLRKEWDDVRADLRRAEDQARDGALEAWRMSRLATDASVKATTDEEQARAGAKQLAAARQFRAVENAAMTARAMALVHLKTLDSTKQALYGYAISLGVRTQLYDLKRIREITSRTLQAWLDPNCPHCNGLGFNDGFSAPKRWCQECGKTGLRLNGPKGFRLGKTDSQHQWGRLLLSHMDRKSQRAEGEMLACLHSQRTANPKVGAAEHAALQQRLVGLRSTEAERD